MWHRFPVLHKGIHALSWISSRVVCFGRGSMNLKIFLHYHMYLIKESETILKHGCLVSRLFLCCGGGGLTKWFFSFLLIKSSFKGWFVLFISTRGMFFSSYFLSGVKGSSFCIVLRRFWKYVLLSNFLPHGSAVHVIVCWYSNS